MCANYHPVTRMDRMLTFFGVERDRDEVPHDVFPTGLAPFIRRAEGGSGGKVVSDGAFGLLPAFAKEIAYGRRTYNARSETVAKLPSFRDSWKRGQRCIVPAESIFEPNWETGKAVRWRIGQHGDVPMGVVGIHTSWRGPDGMELFSFAMLTVNADTHPLMKRFHRPGEEKRMVVILDPGRSRCLARLFRWRGQHVLSAVAGRAACRAVAAAPPTARGEWHAAADRPGLGHHPEPVLKLGPAENVVAERASVAAFRAVWAIAVAPLTARIPLARTRSSQSGNLQVPL